MTGWEGAAGRREPSAQPLSGQSSGSSPVPSP